MAYLNSKTLLQGYDVLREAPTTDKLSLHTIDTYIKAEEERLFNTVLGWDFYEDLLTGKQEITYVNWSPSLTYNVGEYVLFNHVIYECLQATTADGESPTEASSAYWTMFEDFTDSGFQFLWTNYLRKLLAFCVYGSIVLPSSISLTNYGAQMKGGDFSQTPGLKGIEALKQEINIDVKRLFMNMHLFISRNSDDFSNYGYSDGVQLRSLARPAKRQYDGFNVQPLVKNYYGTNSSYNDC